jgi:hypothetical protein
MAILNRFPVTTKVATKADVGLSNVENISITGAVAPLSTQLDGIKLTVINMAQFGVPGGTADDTAALMGLIAQCGPNTQLVPPMNRTLSIQADALSCNVEGIVIGTDRSAHQLSSTGGPRIKLLNDGGYGIKLGAAANYSGAGGGIGPKPGIGLQGVILDFNLRKFTDAAVVFEGMSKAVFKHLLLQRVGADVAGRESIAMRMGCVWDSVFEDVFLHSCYNPGAPIIYAGPKLIDNNGNVNNIKFNGWHCEQLSGQVFASAGTSNADALSWAQMKVESGQGITRVSAENGIWDLDGAQRCVIDGRAITLNRLLSSDWGFGLRVGKTAPSSGDVMIGVNFEASSCKEVVFGVGAKGTVVKGGRHTNPVARLGMTNVSTEAVDYEPATDPSFDDFTHGAMRGVGGGNKSGGWVSANYLTCPNGDQYVGDTSSLFPQQSVLRQATAVAPYTYIAFLEAWKYVDWPDSVTVVLRVKRTSNVLAAALQLTAVSGATSTVQFSTIAAGLGWQVVSATMPQANLVGLTYLIVQYGSGNAQALNIDAISIKSATAVAGGASTAVDGGTPTSSYAATTPIIGGTP